VVIRRLSEYDGAEPWILLLEALSTLVESMNRLEVGKVAVGAIRERLTLLKGFEEQVSSEKLAFVLS